MTTAIYSNSNLATDHPRFPSPFGYREKTNIPQPRTVIEHRMCQLSAMLRSKPQWWIKFKKEAIVAKWKQEAAEQDLGEEQVNYVLAELADYALMRDEQSGAEVSCFDKIWQSDTLISQANRHDLLEAVHKLEDVPDAERDWHPRSNNQVLDLVHPSLYPLVFGRSLVLPDLETAESPDEIDHVVSENYAWLPTNFVIAKDGSSAKAQAYINNIHPSNTALVGVVERIIASFVPLFDRVLTDQLDGNYWNFPLRIPDYYDYSTYDYDPDAQNRYSSPEEIELLDTPTYKSGQLLQRTQTYTINGLTVQIIVKLANIHLTPSNPEYRGGSWHVEGMKNESIVASGIYYYDEENISESRLAFRHAISAPYYRRNDSKGVREVWGFADYEELVQEIGSVQTKKDRCICFPNFYQHCVQPFELNDETKPGYRKILALFLVDPSVSIISTSDVPPQHHEWVSAALKLAWQDRATHLYKLPRELFDMILTNISWTMTKEEAFEHRLELMDERTQFVDELNSKDGFFGTSFNMCEH